MGLRGIVIIPCFNEGNSIGPLVHSIRLTQPTLDILVVDDGSRDSTRIEATKAGAMVISLPMNVGIGGAVQTGLKYAERLDYDFAVQVDGDGQHPPSELTSLISQFQLSHADLVIGSRYLRSSTLFRSTALRRLGIAIIRWAIWVRTTSWITDPTSGYRLMGRQAIGIYSQDYPVDFPEPVSIVILKLRGFRCIEAPIEMLPRRHGVSSIGLLSSVFYMVRVVLSILLRAP